MCHAPHAKKVFTSKDFSTTNAGLVLKSRHFCGGFEIKVSPAHGWYQIRKQNMEQQEGIAQAIFELTSLDDDCLFHIFSFLRLNDLCHVYWTSKRLQSIAINVFNVRHSDFDLTKYSLTPTDLHEILTAFGPNIQKLKLVAMVLKEDARAAVLKLVFKHCESLRSLELTGFKFTVKSAKKICFY